MSTRTCEDCGAAIPSGARDCPRCAAAIASAAGNTPCSRCGAPNFPHHANCYQCEADLPATGERPARRPVSPPRTGTTRLAATRRGTPLWAIAVAGIALLAVGATTFAVTLPVARELIHSRRAAAIAPGVDADQTTAELSLTREIVPPAGEPGRAAPLDAGFPAPPGGIDTGATAGAEWVACLTCGGDGVCPTCEGAGKVTCPSCRGLGRETPTAPICLACGGAGTLPCARCGGSGVCPTCQGAGKAPAASQQQIAPPLIPPAEQIPPAPVPTERIQIGPPPTRGPPPAASPPATDAIIPPKDAGPGEAFREQIRRQQQRLRDRQPPTPLPQKPARTGPESP